MKRITALILTLVFTLFSVTTAFAESDEVVVKNEFLPGIPSENYGYFSWLYHANPPWSNQDGLIKVKNDEGKWGYVDFNGNLIIDYQFEDARDFSDGIAAVDYESYIDTKGEQLKRNINLYAYDYSEGYAVSKGLAKDRIFTASGYVNTNGDLVIDWKFDDAGLFKNGYAPVKMGGKYGFIDKEGNIRVDCKYDKVGSFEEDRAAVYNGEKWAYIDTNGTLITGFQFDEARDFSDGMAVVAYYDKTQQETRWPVYGYIDKSGKMVIDYQYKVANDFSQGLASVSWSNEINDFYIDKQGNKVFDGFIDAGDFSEGYAYASYQKSPSDPIKYGYINSAGEVVVPYEYDSVTNFYDGKALAKKDGVCWVLELNVNRLIERQKNKPISIIVNGQSIAFNDETGYPFIDFSQRTAAPIKAILEAYGAEVTWDSSSKSAIVTKNGTTVEVPIGVRHIFVNGKRQYIDSCAKIINNKTYLPVKAVIEAFGGTVNWDSNQNSILIL